MKQSTLTSGRLLLFCECWYAQQLTAQRRHRSPRSPVRSPHCNDRYTATTLINPNGYFKKHISLYVTLDGSGCHGSVL